jgi:hypothetical protein
VLGVVPDCVGGSVVVVEGAVIVDGVVVVDGVGAV